MKNQKQTGLYWSAGLTVLAAAYCVFAQTSLFESSILITGILCVSFIAIGKKEGYIFGLYNCIAYAYIAYNNGLFGEVFLNILFYVPTSIIGYLMWKKKQKNQTVLMRKLPLNSMFKVLGGLVLVILLLGFALTYFEGQKNPFIDASTNAIGICATLLMLYRYSEQWIFYILLNCITIVLWVLRYVDSSAEADTMIFMWMLFLVNSIYGYFTWIKKSKLETEMVL